jgi:hypothetical protein
MGVISLDVVYIRNHDASISVFTLNEIQMFLVKMLYSSIYLAYLGRDLDGG